jgi:hypothetical protein
MVLIDVDQLCGQVAGKTAQTHLFAGAAQLIVEGAVQFVEPGLGYAV